MGTKILVNQAVVVHLDAKWWVILLHHFLYSGAAGVYVTFSAKFQENGSEHGVS